VLFACTEPGSTAGADNQNSDTLHPTSLVQVDVGNQTGPSALLVGLGTWMLCAVKPCDATSE